MDFVCDVIILWRTSFTGGHCQQRTRHFAGLRQTSLTKICSGQSADLRRIREIQIQIQIQIKAIYYKLQIQYVFKRGVLTDKGNT